MAVPALPGQGMHSHKLTRVRTYILRNTHTPPGLRTRTHDGYVHTREGGYTHTHPSAHTHTHTQTGLVASDYVPNPKNFSDGETDGVFTPRKWQQVAPRELLSQSCGQLSLVLDTYPLFDEEVTGGGSEEAKEGTVTFIVKRVFAEVDKVMSLAPCNPDQCV